MKILNKPDLLYLAYGSNLSERGMRRRCPDAVKVKPFLLKNAALVFRAVADVVPRKGSSVQCGLWRISIRDERTLDSYEGVGFGLYRKVYLQVRVGKRLEPCLIYLMNEEGIMPPSESYLEVIRDGYRDFGLDLAPLEKAVQESWDGKEKTDYLRDRYERKGRPTLAKPGWLSASFKPVEIEQPLPRRERVRPVDRMPIKVKQPSDFLNDEGKLVASSLSDTIKAVTVEAETEG